MIRVRVLCNTLLILITAIVTLGCTEKRSEGMSSERASNEVKTSSADVIPVEGETLMASDSLARPSKIYAVGSYLVILDSYAQPPIHVIRSSDGTYVASLGRPGEGPGEFVSPWSVDIPSREEASFWVHDLTQIRSTHFDIGAHLEGRDPVQEIVNFNIGFTLTSPILINDSLFISPGFLTEDGRLARLTRNGNHKDTVGSALAARDRVPAAVLQHAYQSRMKASPDRSRLVLGTFYADRLEIYSVNGERLALVEGPDLFDPIFEVGTMEGQPVHSTTNETRIGYIDLAITDKRIYALYSGRLRGQQGGWANLVRVFDWNGNYITSYDLQAAAVGIAVVSRDSEPDILYAVQMRPKLEISRYMLPQPDGIGRGATVRGYR